MSRSDEDAVRGAARALTRRVLDAAVRGDRFDERLADEHLLSLELLGEPYPLTTELAQLWRWTVDEVVDFLGERT